jgi:SAM-dependent methyltransferase
LRLQLQEQDDMSTHTFPEGATSMDEDSFRTLIDTLDEARRGLRGAPSMSRAQFEEFATTVHAFQASLKQSVFVNDFRNKADAATFEYAFGAQSAQFMIDILPYLHEVMVAHYARSDELSLVDVGAGSCIGTNLLTMLHSDHVVYSKLNVTAVDHTDVRERWVRALYPMIDYRIADLFDLPGKQWDFVVCSHVIEHVEEPRDFIEALLRICKGFAFVYSPYEEFDRIPHHLSTIVKDTYAGIPGCRLEVMRSMGWRGDIPGNDCLLAIIDCP